jgi:hypothetical protein
VQNIPEFVHVSPIDYPDLILELAPEAYLESRVPDAASPAARLEEQVRDRRVLPSPRARYQL